jgi:uncharacterized protein YxeA
MKKVLIAVGLLVLVGCAAGLILTYRSLGATQSALQETQSTLHEAQTKLQDTAISLQETQQELQDTTKSLAETRQDLEEQKTETTKYIQLYESSAEELENMEEELEELTGELNTSNHINEGLQVTINGLKKKLELYEDTLGVQVFSGTIPPYGSGNLSKMTLVNQDTAEDPTWKQLKAFLLEDKTDKNLYIPGVYECGNFAQDLHNNAEANGIRAAFVGVHFYNEIPHALNAFKTLDRGLVYIDATGSTSNIPLQSLDKKVQLEKDELYRSSLIFPDSWGLDQPTNKVKRIEIYW